MAADANEIEGGSHADTSRKGAGKKHLMTLEDLDGRTRAAQHVSATQEAIFRDLGGEDQLSSLEQAAAKNAALTVAMIHDAGARWLMGQPTDPSSMATLVNAFSGGGWRDVLRTLAPALMMADPLGRNQGMAAMMMRQNDQRRQDGIDAQNRNQTREWLVGQGMDAREADFLVSDPVLLRQWFADSRKTPDPEDALRQEKLKLEIDRMRNPQAKDLINAGDGRLYDPNKQEWITAPAGAGGGKSFTTEQDLRKEYTSLPEYKRYDDVRASYDRVRASAARSTGPGDLGLIFGFMKMLDPGSVVREGEFANAENAGGVPDQVRNLYNRVINGERLTRAQRQEFVGTAGDLYGAEANRMGALNDRYSGIAGQYGIDPGRVIVAPQQYEPLNLPEDKPEAATGQPKAVPKVGEIRHGYRFKGGDPRVPSNWEIAE